MPKFNIGDFVKTTDVDVVCPGRIEVVVGMSNAAPRNVVYTIKFPVGKIYTDNFTDGIYNYFENELELVSRKGEIPIVIDKFQVGAEVVIKNSKTGLIYKIVSRDGCLVHITFDNAATVYHYLISDLEIYKPKDTVCLSNDDQDINTCVSNIIDAYDGSHGSVYSVISKWYIKWHKK